MRRRNYNTKEFSEEPTADALDGKNGKSIHHLSIYYGILFIFFTFSVLALVVHLHGRLPEQVTVENEKDNPGRFIGERSQNDLRLLTSIGPRVTGSYQNEVEAVHFIMTQLHIIKEQAHRNQLVELDLQVVSGSYFLEQGSGFINMYTNVQNIVARLSAKGGNFSSSLLLNSHFDSVPTSPGASDDGISVTTMLEILRVLSQSPTTLKHNVIFLFNGAEETPLQAAHGFITQHKWASEVKAVINLEAAGNGGREILFQVAPGHSWVMQYYINVAPHPYAQVSGEEIFQSNLIPSDTDFRLFRDFGKIPGVDLAFANLGYVYHTKFDSFERIPKGSYQHIGDNILALTKALANSDELNHPDEHKGGDLVFFDILGFTIISYNKTLGIIYNCLTIFLALAVCIVSCKSLIIGLEMEGGMAPDKHSDLALEEYLFAAFGISNTYKQVAMSYGFQILGWLVGVILCILVAVLMDLSNRSMSWYSRPWLVCFLFSFPAIIGPGVFVYTLSIYNQKKNWLSVSRYAQIHTLGTLLIWTSLLIVTTALGLRSAFMLMLTTLFVVIAHLIIVATNTQNSVHTWLFIYSVLTFIPTILSMYAGTILLSIFIPIAGRSGSSLHVDIVIALITSLVTFLVFSFFVPLISLIKQGGRLLLLLFAINFIMVLVAIFTPLGFPYSGSKSSPAPERFWIFHTTRQFYDFHGNLKQDDSGFFLLNMDRNSPISIADYVDDLTNAISQKEMREMCEKEVLCGLPISSIRMVQICNHSTWIPAPPPVTNPATQVKLLSRTDVKPNLVHLELELRGPTRFTVVLLPKSKMRVVDWSMLDFIPEHGYWNDRPMYFILHTHGRHEGHSVDNKWRIWIDLEKPVGWTGPVLDMVVVGNYLHHSNEQTLPYKTFISKFPSWADVTPYISNFQSLVF